METTIANAGQSTASSWRDVLDGELDELPAADLVVANVLLDPVERILARLAGRAAITSGYLATDDPRATGWTSVDRIELDGWAADRFEVEQST